MRGTPSFSGPFVGEPSGKAVARRTAELSERRLAGQPGSLPSRFGSLPPSRPSHVLARSRRSNRVAAS